MIRVLRRWACRWVILLFTAFAPFAAAAESPPADPVAAPAPASAPAALVARFDVLEYVIDGNTTLPAARIEEVVYPFMGEQKTIQDVELARAALEKAYQSAGYLTVFVSLPEQQVKDGVVRLHVAEGKVERLKVSGSRYYSLGAIKAGAPELEEGTVPNFNEVQKELADLNRSAGRKVTPVLRSGRIPGTIEAELKVDDKLPLFVNVEVNDRYSRDTSPTRLNAAVRYDNLWQAGHSLNLTYQVAPEAPEESRVLVATYVAPLASGNTLAVYGVASNTDVSTVGGISSLGNGTIFGLRYVLPLRPLPGLFHSLSLGVDYKDFKDSVQFGNTPEPGLPITYMPFTLEYDMNLNGEKDQTQIGLSTVFSVRGLVSDEAEFAAKRTDASASFMYFKLNLRHRHLFDNGFSLVDGATVQLTGSPLISNEQLAEGGADTVRGYPESAVLGDRGVRVGMELHIPSLAGAWASGLNELNVLGFAEGAWLQELDTTAYQASRFNLASVGVGMRFRVSKWVNGALDYAWPLEDAGGVAAGDGRIHFSLGAEW